MIHQKRCAICGKTYDLFGLELTSDDGEKFQKFVCGSCWDVIAEIAKRAIRAEKMEDEK